MSRPTGEIQEAKMNEMFTAKRKYTIGECSTIARAKYELGQRAFVPDILWRQLENIEKTHSYNEAKRLAVAERKAEDLAHSLDIVRSEVEEIAEEVRVATERVENITKKRGK